VGSEKQLSFPAVGDVVNVAAQLLGAAAEGTIFITDATFALVRNNFACEAHLPLRLDGRVAPVTIYAVKGPRPPLDLSALAAAIAEETDLSQAPSVSAPPPGGGPMNFRPDTLPAPICCGNCGKLNGAQEKFCRHCGMPVF